MRSDNDLRRELEDMGEALDAAVSPVTADEVTGAASERRPSHRRRVLMPAVVVAAVVVIAAVVGLVNRGGDEGDDLDTAGQPGGIETEHPLEARELDEVETSVVGDELWVFGGLTGPDGSEHPVPSSIPDGWAVNETVVMYDIDGRLAFHAFLPGWDGSAVVGDVVADSADRYLVTSTCETNCGTGFQPVVYRLADNRAVPVPVRYSEETSSDFEESWSIEIVGTSGDGLVWATQKRSGAGQEMLQTGRLLAIDLRGGVVTEIPLPESTSVLGPTCLSGDRVYTAFPAGVDPAPFTAGFRVLGRSTTVTEAEWSTAVDPALLVDIGSITDLTCSPAASLTVLGLSAGPGPHRSLTVPVHEPPEDEPASTPLPDDVEVVFVGDVGGQGLYLGWDSSTEESTLYRHTADGRWTAASQELSPDVRPIVLGGEVRDVSAATSRVDPDGVELPVIEIVEGRS